MLIELVNGHRLWPDCADSDKILESVLKLIGMPSDGNSSLENMQEASTIYIKEKLMHKTELWNNVTESLLDLIHKCLIIDPSKRPTSSELLKHPYFEEFLTKYQSNRVWTQKPYLKSSLLPDELPKLGEIINGDNVSSKPNPTRKRVKPKESPAELYHFWKLSGGVIPDLSQELQTQVPIHRFPTIVRLKDFPKETKRYIC